MLILSLETKSFCVLSLHVSEKTLPCEKPKQAYWKMRNNVALLYWLWLPQLVVNH